MSDHEQRWQEMSLFEKLKRRNVFRMAVLYLIAAWLLLQVTDVLSSLLRLPTWAGSLVLLLIVIGFFPVLIFSWIYEMTPEGLKREKEVDRSQSITYATGRKLNIVIVSMLTLTLLVVAADRLWPESASVASSSVVRSNAQQTVAVLPFANRSNLEEDLFFTDGIHDNLLTQLAKIEGLNVISRTSVMQYRNSDKRIPEMAGELGAGTVLEGGAQRAGQRIRINAQLIDVATDQQRGSL